MKEIVVCNAVPSYEEAAVSPALLTEHTKMVIDSLQKDAAHQHILVVAKNQKLEQIPEEIMVIEAKHKAGFSYANHSALLKVLEGEKPIPYCSNKTEFEQVTVKTVEELIQTDVKRVFIREKGKDANAYEFSYRITPREILKQCQRKDEAKGMYFGYPMGLVISESKFDEEVVVTTDYIEIIDKTDCVLDTVTKIIKRFSKESCGRCVFGHEGVAQLDMILTDITLKKGKQSDLELMLDLCEEMKRQSLCEIGTTAAKVVTSAMDTFGEEIEEHITRRSCKAGVCAKFVTYHILADMCTGCNECVDECEDEAILGKKKFIHVIDQEECTQCGACLEACEEEAIVKAGAVKPRCPKKPIPCKR